jgi:DNA-binding beta-propeller fold protein YncE
MKKFSLLLLLFFTLKGQTFEKWTYLPDSSRGCYCPGALIWNSTHNRLYIGGGVDWEPMGSFRMLALDCATKRFTPIELPFPHPDSEKYIYRLAWNPLTDYLYAIDWMYQVTTVIDCRTNQAIEVLPYNEPIIVNTLFNKLYTFAYPQLYILDGNTNQPIRTHSNLIPLFYDSLNNSVYTMGVDDQFNATALYVIDGATDEMVDSIFPVPRYFFRMSYPQPFHFNPARNELYIGSFWNRVSDTSYYAFAAYDLNHNRFIDTLMLPYFPIPFMPLYIESNPINDKIYLSDYLAQKFYIVQAESLRIVDSVPLRVAGFFFNQQQNRLYVFGGYDSIFIFDGQTNQIVERISNKSWEFLSNLDGCPNFAFNPVENRLYYCGTDDNTIGYVDCNDYEVSGYLTSFYVKQLIYNPVTNGVYLIPFAQKFVVILDGVTGELKREVALPEDFWVRVGGFFAPELNKVYVLITVSDYISRILVFDAFTDSLLTISPDLPRMLTFLYNLVSHRFYGAGSTHPLNNYTYSIDPNTLTVTDSIMTYTLAASTFYNPINNKLYELATYTQGQHRCAVIDCYGDTIIKWMPDVYCNKRRGLLVSRYNRLYVENWLDSTFIAIDCSIDSVIWRKQELYSTQGFVYDSLDDEIYVACGQGIYILKPETNEIIDTLPVEVIGPMFLNNTTHHLFVPTRLNSENRVVVLDTRTNEPIYTSPTFFDFSETEVTFVSSRNLVYFSDGAQRSRIGIFRDEPSAIAELGSENEYFRVYPNPSKKGINIEFNNLKNGIRRITVYDVVGEKVFEVKRGIEGKKMHIKIDLPSGIYILKVDLATRTITKKFLVVK